MTVVQHNLEQLGPFGFQDLSAALMIAQFGPNVQVLGAGRDGGRDMYHHGVLIFSGDEQGSKDLWNGYTVFQVKHKQRLSGSMTDAAWLWGEIKKELDAWADPESGRDQVPQYWVVITNVRLSPVPEVGGLATVEKNIQGFLDGLTDDSRDVDNAATQLRLKRKARMSRLREWRIWDANQVDSLLTVYAGVRRAFNAFLTVPDVFAHLADFTDRLPLTELEPGLRRHSRSALVGERSIYFDEAGAAEGTGIPIEQIAIDLPITPGSDGRRRTVFGHILDRGEHVLRPRLGVPIEPRHVVIAGGPGNGKTTISKFLVQIYRAALLAGGSDLGADHQAVIDGTRERLRTLGRDLPQNRRWPMRIDLAEYVEEHGLGEDSTLLRWIAHKVSKRSNLGEVTPRALDSWMRQWPWFLVLDGLDEVTEPMVRKRLIRHITEFVSDAEADDCDLLAVVTTRPTGYVENIAPNLFERVDLSRLEVDQAVQYGMLTTRVRLSTDLDKIERIVTQLQRAAETKSLRHLMQTPLQVLIMTIIIEGAGRLAPDRYGLFWAYYDTVFKRERSKPGPSGRLLRDYAPHILKLHERVGFELQIRSEIADGAAAVMSIDELRQVAWQVLDDAKFRPSDTDADLLEEIVKAATHRLVLLAPHGEEGLGFDVRSLQELMAARRLTTGTTESVIKRLRRAAASPHWRNTWVFAAGRYFAEPQDYQHESIVALVENLDSDAAHRLGLICPVGPYLALDLVDDGMARSHPGFHDRLMRRGLDILSEPLLADPLAVARVLVRAADISDRVRQQIAEALRDALAAEPFVRETASRVLDSIATACSETGVGQDALTLTGVRARQGKTAAAAHDRQQWWQQFHGAVSEWTDSEEWGPMVTQAADGLRRLVEGAPPPGDPNGLAQAQASDESLQGLIQALPDATPLGLVLGFAGDEILQALEGHPEAAAILEMALDGGVLSDPLLVARLRDEVLQFFYRVPVGDRLR